MAYTELSGNIFNSNAGALANTVNCQGVMGKGIALEFRRRFPQMYAQYRTDCQAHALQPGHIYYYFGGKRLILNISTKNDWRQPSRIEWIETALDQFSREYQERGIRSIAIPLLGAENGKLAPNVVKSLMRSKLQDLRDIDVEVYDFDPAANDPLFRKLEKLVGGEHFKSQLQKIGIGENQARSLIAAVRGGSVRSMFMLSRAGILSERAMDAFYKLLGQEDNDADTGTQLSFLA